MQSIAAIISMKLCCLCYSVIVFFFTACPTLAQSLNWTWVVLLREPISHEIKLCKTYSTRLPDINYYKFDMVINTETLIWAKSTNDLFKTWS